MSAPPLIRHHEAPFSLNRTCAGCDHACHEFEWLCFCCQRIGGRASDTAAQICAGARQGSRAHGPLLPPHVPEHIRARLEATEP